MVTHPDSYYQPINGGQSQQQIDNLALQSQYTQNNGGYSIDPSGNIIPITTLTGSPNPTTLPTQATQTYPTITPPPPTVVDPMQQILNDYTSASNANAPDPHAGENAYNADVANAGISGLQTGVNTATSAMNAEQANLEAINAQLTTIANEGTAQNLALENQGAQITSGGVSKGQTANNREIAIRALPLQSLALVSQAKIQGLKGNLDAQNTLLSQANDRVNKLFEIQQTDLKNTTDYKQKQIDTFYDFATKKEQGLLDAEKTRLAQENNDRVNNLNQAQAWATTAISNGQGALAGQIMALDPKDPNYQTKLGQLAGQIKAKAPTQSVPSSYQEWSLAGGLKGTGKTYAEFLGGSAPTTTEEKAFNSDLQTQLDGLAKGNSWADTYNFFKNRYGVSNPELIAPMTADEKQKLIAQGYKVDPEDQTMLDVILGKHQYYSNK